MNTKMKSLMQLCQKRIKSQIFSEIRKGLQLLKRISIKLTMSKSDIQLKKNRRNQMRLKIPMNDSF